MDVGDAFLEPRRLLPGLVQPEGDQAFRLDQAGELRRVVEELADILTSPGSYDDDEREGAVQRARLVLQATAPRVPVKDGRDLASGV